MADELKEYSDNPNLLIEQMKDVRDRPPGVKRLFRIFVSLSQLKDVQSIRNISERIELTESQRIQLKDDLNWLGDAISEIIDFDHEPVKALELKHSRGRRGEVNGAWWNDRKIIAEIQGLINEGVSKENAISKVAGDTNLENSYRGKYDRGIKSFKQYKDREKVVMKIGKAVTDSWSRLKDSATKILNNLGSK